MKEEKLEEKYYVQAKEILDPILDVFAASDGGVSFANLTHGFMPNFIKIAEDEPDNAAAQQTIDSFIVVSKFCKYLLNKK